MVSLISCLVFLNLFIPEFNIALNTTVKSAVMTMPESSINIDGNPIFGKNDIRMPGVSLIIFPEPVSQGEEETAQ